MTIELLTLEVLAAAAVATWLVLLPMRAAGRLGPVRGRLSARPARRPAAFSPALHEHGRDTQGSVVAETFGAGLPAGGSVAALAGAALVGAGQR